MGELETHDLPLRFQHPEHLLEPLFHVGQVPDAETHHGGVIAVVLQGQQFSIGLQIGDAPAPRRGVNLGATACHHLPVDIAQSYETSRPDLARGQQRQVRCAAADIQHAITFAQGHHPDGKAFPEIVDAEAEKGVHEIVLLSDGIEMLTHPGHLFPFRNVQEAEMSQTGW